MPSRVLRCHAGELRSPGYVTSFLQTLLGPDQSTSFARKDLNAMCQAGRASLLIVYPFSQLGVRGPQALAADEDVAVTEEAEFSSRKLLGKMRKRQRSSVAARVFPPELSHLGILMYDSFVPRA